MTMEDVSGLMADSETSIRTVWGRIDLLDPYPDLPPLAQLAVPLNRLRRFTGHGVELPMTLLRHLLHVVQILRDDLGVHGKSRLLAGLLHDVHEAWTGDVSRPQKLALRHLTGGRSAFDELETIGKRAVVKRYAPHLTDLSYPCVVEADARALGW
jgi:hypothetical protein